MVGRAQAWTDLYEPTPQAPAPTIGIRPEAVQVAPIASETTQVRPGAFSLPSSTS
jgi:hypothetical protein